MSEKRKYDSTIARIAGNILSGNSDWLSSYERAHLAREAVATARAIVAEVERTEPRAAELQTDPDVANALGGLRHAYEQLVLGVVKNQKEFADGLIAPAIRRIESLQLRRVS